jgi:predicted 2-oxoglutarate/Fe(II)-dependent dioxygenase YbiX
MATEPDKNLPPFQIVATAKNFLSDAEMDRLIAEHEPLLTEGMLGAGESVPHVRRSQVAFLGLEDKHRWLYGRIWEAAEEINRLGFGVDISAVEGNIQLARYASGDLGFYDWHTDFAGYRPLRKISISIQLSRPEDYDGGDLELHFNNRPQSLEKARGALLAFPSFVLHRVAPVTRGTRFSLVAWVLGNRWR